MDLRKLAGYFLLFVCFSCFALFGLLPSLVKPTPESYVFVIIALVFLLTGAASGFFLRDTKEVRNTTSPLPQASSEVPLLPYRPREDIVMGQVADTPMSASVMIDGILGHIITSTMTCVEIVDLLKKHGCVDLTLDLDQSAASQRPIAQGGLGDVFFGRIRDGTPIAIKTIREYGGEPTGVYQKRAAREVYVWSRCSHKNVARMVGLAVFNGSLAMVSRWETHGNMMYYLSRNPSVDRCQMIIGVCAGLTYLHDNNIVHGDLKGANVLIDQDENPMLTDFGNATLMNSTLGFTSSKGGAKYTVRWAAPEILSEGIHTASSDVYSLGMTILETLTSTIPFDNLKSDHAVIMHVISRKPMPARPEAAVPKKSIYGDQVWEIINKCWSYDPLERPTAREVWDVLKPLTPEKLNKIEDGDEKGEE